MLLSLLDPPSAEEPAVASAASALVEVLLNCTMTLGAGVLLALSEVEASAKARFSARRAFLEGGGMIVAMAVTGS